MRRETKHAERSNMLAGAPYGWSVMIAIAIFPAVCFAQAGLLADSADIASSRSGRTFTGADAPQAGAARVQLLSMPALEGAGVDASYLPCRVGGEPVTFVTAFRALDVQGYSVTIPHQQAIMPAMDEVDNLVEQVGALNTVVNRDGRLFGANTDVPAALCALQDALAAYAQNTGD